MDVTSKIGLFDLSSKIWWIYIKATVLYSNAQIELFSECIISNSIKLEMSMLHLVNIDLFSSWIILKLIYCKLYKLTLYTIGIRCKVCFTLDVANVDKSTNLNQ